MRLKHVFTYVPVPVYAKIFWERVTFSRLTLIYLVFSLLHFLVQLALQTRAFTINASAFRMGNDLLGGSAHANGLPFYSNSTLRICQWVPLNLDLHGGGCTVVWPVPQPNTPSQQDNVPSHDYGITTSIVLPSSPERPQAGTTPTTSLAIPASAASQSPGLDVSVTIDKICFDLRQMFGRDASNATSTTKTGIDPVCAQALSYPLSILNNTKREDIVFIAFQFWVLGMSVVALLNESIPHIFASLLTHMMATAWGGLQLAHTARFRSEVITLITEGACQGLTGLPINPAYWDSRRSAEISSLVLNVVALLVSCFLSWRLFKLFGWQTFKRVGASLVINRVYKFVLVLSITIQLSLFFMAVTVSLWLDRLINNVIGDFAAFRKAYLASSIITLILLVPWLMMGWFGVRRELRIPMLTFLVLCVGYLGGWSVMFASTTFRWTFITWSFFSIIATVSVILTVACLILGLICRMNFGKGLPRYLNSQEELPGGEFGIVTPEYESYGYDNEKVDFPSTEKPMPTFNAAYGNGFPARGHVFITNGPRFFNQSPQFGAAVVLPPQALTRAPSDRSTHSHSSEKSSSSWDSYYNYSHSRDNSHGQSKRWVIE
ncbi:hypothetical protein AN958_06080 [Leucoagaricus sp. SymC.cos]|nr:hypothetical protein AN958_06080 [Leucoagaricus sp. SymC.cos]